MFVVQQFDDNDDTVAIFGPFHTKARAADFMKVCLAVSEDAFEVSKLADPNDLSDYL